MRNLICIGKSMMKTAGVMGVIGVEWLLYTKVLKLMNEKESVAGVIISSLAVAASVTATGTVFGSAMVEDILDIE